MLGNNQLLQNKMVILAIGIILGFLLIRLFNNASKCKVNENFSSDKLELPVANPEHLIPNAPINPSNLINGIDVSNAVSNIPLENNSQLYDQQLENFTNEENIIPNGYDESNEYASVMSVEMPQQINQVPQNITSPTNISVTLFVLT